MTMRYIYDILLFPLDTRSFFRFFSSYCITRCYSLIIVKYPAASAVSAYVIRASLHLSALFQTEH